MSAPAFPSPGVLLVEKDGTQRQQGAYEGMTLRDYFAAHAPITVSDAVDWLDTYGGEVVGPWPPEKVMGCLVELRQTYADAMLEARNA